MEELVVPPPALEPPLAAAPRLAGLWRRALAVALDYLFLLLALGVSDWLARVLWGEPARAPRVVNAAVRAFHWFLPPLYATLFHWRWGQTMGKIMVGARVVGPDGGSLSLGRALGRTLAWLLAALPLGAGFLLAVLPDKRGLHDRLADTRVERV